MVTMTPALDRVRTQPWAAAGAVALLLVGLQGLWSAAVTLSFAISPGPGFGDWSIRGEILRSEWGFYLAYAALVVATGAVLWSVARSGAVLDWWPLVWRTAVLYLPAYVVVVVVLAIGSALVHGGSLYLFGIEVVS